MDLKVMPRSYKGYKFIFVVTDEVTNFMVTIPICARAQLISQCVDAGQLNVLPQQ